MVRGDNSREEHIIDRQHNLKYQAGMSSDPDYPNTDSRKNIGDSPANRENDQRDIDLSDNIEGTRRHEIPRMFSYPGCPNTDSRREFGDFPPNRENDPEGIVRWIRDIDLSDNTEQKRRQIPVKDPEIFVRTDNDEKLEATMSLTRYNTSSQTGRTKFILISQNLIPNREEMKKLICERLTMDHSCRLLERFAGNNLLFNLPTLALRDIFNVTVKHMTVEVGFFADHKCMLSCFVPNNPNSTGCRCEKVLSALETILKSQGIQFYTITVVEENAFCKCSDEFISIDYRNVSKLLDIELEFENIENTITSFLSDGICNTDKQCSPGPLNTATASFSLSHFVELRQMHRTLTHKFVEKLQTIFGTKSIQKTRRSDTRVGKSQDVLEDSTRSITNDNPANNLSHGGIDENDLSQKQHRRVKTPTYKLLNTVAQCLTQKDWLVLREELSYKLSPILLDQLDEKYIFNELLERKYIDEEKLDFIRELFYTIRRVDLVHVIDCWAEGSDSYLNFIGQLVTKERSSSGKTEDNTRNDEQHCVIGIRRSAEIDELQSDGQPLRLNDCSKTRTGGRITRTRAADVSRSILPKEHTEEDSTSTEAPLINSNCHVEPKVSCEHYDRFCTVKFACCEEFWACHRCHNSRSKCGQKKLKACDSECIKCNRCGKIQKFPTERPHCIECNLKFSEYFCPICKHLTGTNNKPYHCKDCGICRVSKDNSFHCNICGYCMDLCLKGNHKCRPNSAHDTCFICLEDAFFGCQILPCSHKVHRNCAQTMIRRGITRCAVCRESFAHKINRRSPCK